MPKSSINLLLIGPVAVGKTSVANTILGENIFESKRSGGSSTKKVTLGQRESENEDGRIICIADTPGLCGPDSRNSVQDELKQVMSIAMTECQNGYHAAFLVFRYSYIHSEAKQVADSLLRVLGHKFLEEHCFIIVTFGDNFEKDQEDTKEDFEKWCTKQDQYFQNLLGLCGNRVFLFNNKEGDSKKQRQQVNKLVNMVVEFQLKSGKRLTNDRFEAALNRRRGCSVM